VRCALTLRRPTICHVIYEIRVRGHLGPTVLRGFAALQAETDGEDTVLVGPLRDQAALHGVLAQIEGLGLGLLEVRRLPVEATE
jgi:monoterpene epsilon-lactone hydrolase